ncbi:MAG: galactose-1-phosphate uridylyltransferase [Actinomycetes bacterium]
MTERRWDPVTGEWRTFATHRQDRTFLPPAEACPLCPTPVGATTTTEVPEPAYQIVVFDNQFPSLSAQPPEPTVQPSDLYDVLPAVGAAEVVLYSDQHNATFTDLDIERVRRLIDVWADRYAVLGARHDIGYVFIFENKGAVIGVTIDHPHGQIYGFPDVPPRPRRELDVAAAHLAEHGTCVYCDVVAHEQSDGVRVVSSNEDFLAFVPFAARFPYEVHVTSLRHAASLLDLSDPERRSFAEVLLNVARAYDGLFAFSMPYVMAMHQSPTDDGEWLAVSHLHVEFTPPYRTADKLKYLAGAELAAGAFINDTVPEATAAALRRALDEADGHVVGS